MFLLFDIGNTNIKVGLADKVGILAQFTLPNDPRQTADGLGLALERLCRHLNLDPHRLAVCLASSVSPVVSHLLSSACHDFLSQKLLFAPEDIPIPLRNCYASPQEVGADRLVGAYASRRLEPGANSLITVDYGTATTFDFVTEDSYLGGLICPGVYSSLEALATKTAKLPQVALAVDAQEPAIGRSTVESINHGVVFGFAAMTEGLVNRLAPTLPGPLKTVATGGFAQSIAKVAHCFDLVRPDLLLEGLRLLYLETEPECAA